MILVSRSETAFPCSVRSPECSLRTRKKTALTFNCGGSICLCDGDEFDDISTIKVEMERLGDFKSGGEAGVEVLRGLPMKLRR
ncbi:hypothetical protein L1987_68689 [Smallanthus sonchifolius]|uniref:Uncharacterized protein n=1 Tax=Smallanthus sonchifolius TaxID=185202 RepID=A0ACB9B4T5_9ASTR|nr:hypothetical protein L1987_68689 [Smallanthus sonchifolius]